MIRSSEQGTAYLRGASIGESVDGGRNKGVGLSHYKNAISGQAEI